jgi:hypothetical protein
MFDPSLENSQEKTALSQIIEYVLDHNNQPIKIVETLKITHDDKNTITTLLEKRDLYNIRRLFSISQIIFTNPEILMHRDKAGRDVFSYFIEYGTYDLIEKFLKMLNEYSSTEEKKALLSNVDNSGKSHLIMICENKKFETLEDTFKQFIDIVATSCGLDFLHELLTKTDNDGNNILMACLKSHNYKIASQIVDLIPKVLLDKEMRVKVEEKLLTARDRSGQNVLILLSQSNVTKQLQDAIINLVKEMPNNWVCLTDNDIDGHNTISLAILNNNQSMIDNTLSILSSMGNNDKKLVLDDLCKKFDCQNENFISLCFKQSKSTIYLRIIEEVEKVLEEETIVECFRKTFSIHKDLLHYALIDSNIDAILSIIKYLKLVNNITDNDKLHISELITKKDSSNTSLLSHAVSKSNLEVCDIILSTAKEFCDPITLKIIISSKDSNGNGPYVVAKLNNQRKIQEKLCRFAEETNNKEAIASQIIHFEKISTINSSHIKPLVQQVFA